MLGSGDERDAAFEWDMNGEVFTGAYVWVYAVVDPGNVISELEESNNVGEVRVVTSLDSDGDGALDGDELRLGSDPEVADSDGDGLLDGEELYTYGSDPWKEDTDGDGMPDLAEAIADTDLRDSESVLRIEGIDAWGTNNWVRIRWQGGRDAVQYLMRAERLTGDGSEWTVVYTNLPPTAIITNLIDEVGSNQMFFYRIKACRGASP